MFAYYYLFKTISLVVLLKAYNIQSYIIYIQIADETAALWSQLPPNSPIELQQEFFTMTIKGITRTCFGDTFNTNEEIRKMTESDSKVCFTHKRHKIYEVLEIHTL